MVEGETVVEIGVPGTGNAFCYTANPSLYNGALLNDTKFYISRVNSKTVEFQKGNNACNGGSGPKASYDINIKVPAGDPEPTGVVHTLGNEARWALATFNPVDTKQGAQVRVPYGYDPVNEPDPALNMVEVLRNLTANPANAAANSAPVAEGYYEMVRYHAQVSPKYSDTADATRSYFYGKATAADPWFEWETGRGSVHCRRSNIILLSDGRSFFDGDGIADWDGDGDDPKAFTKPWPPAAFPGYDPAPDNNITNVGNNALLLDDAAFCGRMGGLNSSLQPCVEGSSELNGLRPDLPGRQVVDGYFIYAFGAHKGAANINHERGLPYAMYWSGANGIFTDTDGDRRVDGAEEWDEDGDGVPDGFFDASDAREISRAIRKAIERIIKRTSAGTSVAVLSQSGEGEASLFQAYFHPEFFDGTTTATWIGFLRGLWLDKFGNIRQDSSGPGNSAPEAEPDQHLVLKDDRIIKYRFDALLNETFVDLYKDADADGVTSAADKDVSVRISDLKSLFEAGERLHRRAPWSRTIYTAAGHSSNVRSFFPTADWYTDSDGDGISDFADMSVVPPATGWTSEANWAVWYHMGYSDNQDTFLYPTHPFIQTWRPRELYASNPCTWCGYNTWKLGDIVYSTPVAVGAPSTRYDQIYGGKAVGYGNFFTAHTSRPQIVYVGANDGQLRAFYVGTFRNGGSPTRPDADAWFDTKCDPKYSVQCTTGVPIGTEIWSWIPRNTFPSLKFLTRGDYCHTYYVDGEPFVTDAQIFNPANPMYPDGWGSILVVTARLGCKSATMPTETFSPFVLILDVTNPFNPQPFAEYTHPELGFSTVQPTIMRGDGGEWFLVFASGPGDYNFTTPYTGLAGGTEAKLHVLRFDGGGVRDYEPFVVSLPDVSGTHYGEIAARPIAIDLENDFDVDTLYLPTTLVKGVNTYDGRVLRITTRASSDDVGKVNPDPTKWEVTEFFRTKGAVVSSPRFANDDQGKPWIYFGTGRYLNVDDPGDTELQHFIGVRDSALCMQDPFTATDCGPFDMDDVVTIEGCILKPDGSGFQGSCSTSSGDDSTAAEICEEVLNNKRGWAIALLEDGERSISRALVNRRTVIFSTFMPGGGAVCGGGGGSSRVYFADYRCGVPLAIQESTSTGGSNIISLGSSVAVADTVGQIELIDNVADFDELSGVQMYMTPYLEQ